jgi:hypothetical protein
MSVEKFECYDCMGDEYGAHRSGCPNSVTERIRRAIDRLECIAQDLIDIQIQITKENQAREGS